MPVAPKALAIFVGPAPEAYAPPVVPPPSPSDVLYERGYGREGKKCDNCVLYAEQSKRCLLFGGEYEVLPNQVCGYHAPGEPQLYASTLGGMPHVDPELAGLITAPEGGTRCGNCRAYDGDDLTGCCAAVFVEGHPAPVENMGCCARWKPRDPGP